MNNFIKSIIEEKFASKAQQRYFYAQAGKGGKKGKKFAKLAKEFSDKTDFKKIPEKVKKEEEVIDDPAERDERAKQMGFDPNLPDDKIRLVENPRTFIEEYLESILKGKAKDNEIVDHGLEEDEDIEINGIVKKQIKSLKNSMKTFGLKPGHILKGLKDDNE